MTFPTYKDLEIYQLCHLTAKQICFLKNEVSE